MLFYSIFFRYLKKNHLENQYCGSEHFLQKRIINKYKIN